MWSSMDVFGVIRLNGCRLVELERRFESNLHFLSMNVWLFGLPTRYSRFRLQLNHITGLVS